MVELNDLSTIKSNEMLMFNVRYVMECVPSRDTDLFFYFAGQSIWSFCLPSGKLHMQRQT